ncbi:putative esterase [Fonsecaea pedrosoi]|nr:putative esterase [Fonsecaea pedrosoi]
MVKPKYWHATRSLLLKTKDGRTTSFADLCKSLIPSCRLNPFLFNGHLQTIWTVLTREDVPIYYKRRIFENEDPVFTGQFSVDFVTSPNNDSDASLPSRTTYFTEQEFQNIGSLDNRPMLIMLHGLSGGSHELYLRHVLAPLVGEGGWEACVVISRGCAMSKTTSSVLYNARATWDMRQIVKWLRTTFPNRPLFGMGFSLGANIITNYLGEEGSNCPLKAAVILSNPWDLHAANLALQRTWFRRNAYSANMGQSMKKLFERHVDQISQNPKIDVGLVRQAKYLHEFDRYVQGPTWGYPTEGAYYRDASSVDSALSIRIPFLAIHAEDDPTMANDVDLDSISKTDGKGAQLEGQISRGERQPLKPVFEPMRRKMHVPGL